jgi:hypothetical protein
VRRDVDICGQFHQEDLEQRELRLESQLGAVREFAADQRARQQDGARSSPLSQFLTAAEAAAQGRVTPTRGTDTNDGASDEDEYEEADREGGDEVRSCHAVTPFELPRMTVWCSDML